MQAIAEISMYPLTRDYDDPILGFIAKIRDYEGLEVLTGETSTVIRGEYTRLMGAIQAECGAVLAGDLRTVFVIKLLNTR